MLLSCGDALIDFVPVKAADGRDAYVPAVEGSCLDIAAPMSRPGSHRGFIGGILTDMFGTIVANSRDELAAALAFDTRCAAVTCSRAGANPPWKSEISPSQDR